MFDEVEHEIETGQVYRDDRSGDYIEIVYIDMNICVSQDESGGHRLIPRRGFDKNVAAGRYKLQPDMPSFAHTGDGTSEPINFEQIDNIGESGAENLRAAGYETADDIRRAQDEDILAVSWVGEQGLSSIKAEIDG